MQRVGSSLTRAPTIVAAVVVACAIGVGAARAETPIPPAPERWLTDRASFVSPAAAAQIDQQLASYERQSGHQLLVYIDRTTGGVPIEDWAVRAFEAWRVGRKGLDDGVVLFIFSDDRRLRIEVGYGLEETLPDARGSRIINDTIVPRIRAGDRDGAVRSGVDAIVAALGAAPGSGAASDGARPRSVLPLVAGGFFLVLFLVLAVTHPRLAWLMLLSIGSGRGGGGWGGGGGGWSGGGGGFSGGGGRSGGGGASGSW
jgi:uncharacterized protein